MPGLSRQCPLVLHPQPEAAFQMATDQTVKTPESTVQTQAQRTEVMKGNTANLDQYKRLARPAFCVCFVS